MHEYSCNLLARLLNGLSEHPALGVPPSVIVASIISKIN